jgi:hypothetical protein
MTISDQTAYEVYTANGVSSNFAFNHPCRTPQELSVKYKADSDAAETTWVYLTDFTVTGTPDSNGNYPDGLTVVASSLPPSGAVVSIERSVNLTQTADYTTSGKFPAETHEKALDKLTMIVQDLKRLITRSVLVAATSGLSSLTLPTPSAGKALQWKDDLSGLENTTYDPDEQVTLATTQATNAAASAAAAASSATAAATAETNAEAAEVNAETAQAAAEAAQAAAEAAAASIGLTTKGDLVTHNGANSTRFGVGTNTHVLTADSAQANGIKWALPHPLTTKGDIPVYHTSAEQRLPVGTDGQVLTADSAQTAGIKWATPSTGGLVLLATQTASNSASIDFTSFIDSTYDEYILSGIGIVPATDAVAAYLRVSEDAGSSWKSGAGDYKQVGYVNGLAGGAGGTSATEGQISIAHGSTVGNAATKGFNFKLHFFKPAGTALHKVFQLVPIGYETSSGDIFVTMKTGIYIGTTNAINGVRFLFSSGNIISGSFSLYGVKKS